MDSVIFTVHRVSEPGAITKSSNLTQTADSWRSIATFKFCFDGKAVSVEDGGLISVEGDELDEEFLGLASHISTHESGFWSDTYRMLKEKGRGEVLEHLRTHAIARGLR